MTENEKIIKRFVEASIKYGEAIEIGDSKKANRQSKIVRDIRKQLKDINELRILNPFMEYENDYVKLHVAASLISILPDESIVILKKLQNKKGLIAFEAQMFLQEWEKGNIKI